MCEVVVCWQQKEARQHLMTGCKALADFPAALAAQLVHRWGQCMQSVAAAWMLWAGFE
jgi:hypothetical protein